LSLFAVLRSIHLRLLAIG